MKKLNKLTKTLLITAGFLTCSAATVLAASYDGQVESATDTKISGWAKDLNSPDSSASVTIAIVPEGQSEAVKETTIQASEFRDSSDYSPHIAGYCGYTWNIDWSQLDNGTYKIQMQAGSKKIRKTLTYTNTQGKELKEPEEPASPAAAAAEGSRSLGVFKTTAYCPCYSCSEGWGRRTSTGAIARSKHTIAVDPKVIPYGSKVLIDGIVYTAEDKGGGVKGNHIDIYYDSHIETRNHGLSYKEVYLIL